MNRYLIYVQDQRAIDMLVFLQKFGDVGLLDFAVATLKTGTSIIEIQKAIATADTAKPFNYILVEASDCCHHGDGRLASAAEILRN